MTRVAQNMRALFGCLGILRIIDVLDIRPNSLSESRVGRGAKLTGSLANCTMDMDEFLRG